MSVFNIDFWFWPPYGIAYDFDFYDAKYDFDDDNTTTYKIEGNKIIHKYSDGGTYTCIIKSFTDDILVLQFSSGGRSTCTFKKLPNIILP